MRLFSVLLASACVLASSQGCSTTNAASPPAPVDSGMEDLDGGPEADAAPGPQAATGAPCMLPEDCGQERQCFTVDKQSHVYPGGYCSSACRPAKNDPTTLVNPECPGHATCATTGAVGFCLVTCGRAGDPPCKDGYSCFNEGCLPTKGFSECDPSGPHACPNGPVNPAAAYPAVCVPLGPDPVGECHLGCDVFKQDCPSSLQQGCYAETFYGEFVCLVPSGTGKEGDTCVNLNGCAPGFVCQTEGSARVCRTFCGGPTNVGCPAGQGCVDLSPSVPKAMIGRCRLGG